MLFYESFVFGRVANLSLKKFGYLCRLGWMSSKLSLAEIAVVQSLCDRVNSAVPVPIGITSSSTWIVFTDGACEAEVPSGSVGGVLIAPNGRLVHHFGWTDCLCILVIQSTSLR